MEIAGQLSTIYVVVFRIGFLMAYIIGIGLPHPEEPIDFSSTHYWQFMLAFPIITMTLQTILLFVVYSGETPKFLYLNGKKAESRRQIEKIYTDPTKVAEVESKLEALVADASAGSSSTVSYGELFGRTYRKALFVVLGNAFPG